MSSDNCLTVQIARGRKPGQYSLHPGGLETVENFNIDLQNIVKKLISRWSTKNETYPVVSQPRVLKGLHSGLPDDGGGGDDYGGDDDGGDGDDDYLSCGLRTRRFLMKLIPFSEMWEKFGKSIV